MHFTALQHRLKLGIVDNKQATRDFTPKRLHIWRNIVQLALGEDMQEHNPLPVTVRHEASEPAAPTLSWSREALLDQPSAQIRVNEASSNMGFDILERRAWRANALIMRTPEGWDAPLGRRMMAV